MKLVESELTTILYEKEGGETSARVIIPTNIPNDLLRALDVSEVDPVERAELQALYAEYKEYKASFMEAMFNFETWVEHTQGKIVRPKWRSFKASGLR